MTPETRLAQPSPAPLNGLAPLDGEALRKTCNAKGPFLTFQVPAYRPAGTSQPRDRVLKDLIRRADQQLDAATLHDRAEGLLKPVHEFLSSHKLDGGGSGFVLYRSEGFFGAYETDRNASPQVLWARHPHVSPFLESAMPPQHFFVLGLSQKYLRLLECRNGICSERELPETMPASPTENFATPQRGLNRSAPVGGQGGGASFGTSTDDEKLHKHVHDYFKAIDRELAPILFGRPLLLAGVNEEIAAYREAVHYPHLLSTEISGNIDRHSTSDLATEATETIRLDWLAKGSGILRQMQETSRQERTLSDAIAVVEAAAAGRVHQLCVRTGASISGRLPVPLNTAHGGEEDLVNAACAATLETGGDVFPVAQDQMDESQPLLALLRY